jgi:uncharacterized OB-fold protein
MENKMNNKQEKPNLEQLQKRMNRTVNISYKDSNGEHEFFLEHFDCPKCNDTIFIDSNYCSECGVALNWVDK